MTSFLLLSQLVNEFQRFTIIYNNLFKCVNIYNTIKSEVVLERQSHTYTLTCKF